MAKITQAKKTLPLLSIQDIVNAPPPVYIIHQMFQVGAVSLIYGESGTGKSFIITDIGLHAAHGKEWQAYKVKECYVWYISTEGNASLKKRYLAWYKKHELPFSLNFQTITETFDLQTDYQSLLNTMKAQERKPNLIIIDNLSMCTDIDQNKQNEVAPLLRAMHYIADTYKCHIAIIHHSNSTGKFNGSMAFKNHVDMMIEIKKVHPRKHNSPIIFHCEKPRDDEPFKDIILELEQVYLYPDSETGEPITSCVIVDSSKSYHNDQEDTSQAHLHVLESLYEHESLRWTKWKELCEERCNISGATFSRILRTVRGKGLIDQSGKKYQLTEKGMKLMDRKLSRLSGNYHDSL